MSIADTIRSDCFVYVIAHVAEGMARAPIKVGLSAVPDARLPQLQTGNPYPLAVVYRYRVPNRQVAAEIENCIRETQSAWALQGEWYDIRPGQAVALVGFALETGLEAFTRLDDAAMDLAREVTGIAGAIDVVRALERGQPLGSFLQ